MNAEAMYAEMILDYYRHPRNFGVLDAPTAKAKDVNISCGDEIEIQIRVEEGKVSDIKFCGKGCAISQAATSMLTEFVQGKSVKEAAQIQKEAVLDMLQIPISPMRLKCALLGLKVFKVCSYGYLGQQSEEENYG